MSSIGIMDGAFFVGRKEIIDWINTLLELNIQRIEDTANGAISCQLLDIIYPNSIPMSKVNWAANKDFEYLSNYKILQTGFTKNNVEKYVDVDRLITGRYMDNLEFMQWFKRYFEMNSSGKGDYDAISQRAKGKGGNNYFPITNGSKKTSAMVKPSTTTVNKAVKETSKPTTTTNTTPSTTPSTTVGNKGKSNVGKTTTSPAVKSPGKIPPSKPTAAVLPSTSSSTSMINDELKSQLKALQQVNEDTNKSLIDLKEEFVAVEKERDFYFEKLRDIEILIQEVDDKNEGNDLTKAILKILYATAEGFDVVEDNVIHEDHLMEGSDTVPETDETF